MYFLFFFVTCIGDPKKIVGESSVEIHWFRVFRQCRQTSGTHYAWSFNKFNAALSKTKLYIVKLKIK